MAGRHSDQPSGRRQANRERWLAHVQAQEHGGLNQREYCRHHELAFASFARWRRLVLQSRTTNGSVQSSGFVPVVVPSTLPTLATSTAPSLTMVLGNGMRLEGITAENVGVVAALVGAL